MATFPHTGSASFPDVTSQRGLNDDGFFPAYRKAEYA